MSVVSRMIAHRVVLAALAATLGVLGLVAVSQHSASGASFSKGGVSITVSVTCPTTGTTVTKVSSSGGNPGYAARAESKQGTWYQGPEVSSGTSTEKLAATEDPVSGHGVRIFWAAGAQNYTFC